MNSNMKQRSVTSYLLTGLVVLFYIANVVTKIFKYTTLGIYQWIWLGIVGIILIFVCKRNLIATFIYFVLILIGSDIIQIFKDYLTIADFMSFLKLGITFTYVFSALWLFFESLSELGFRYRGAKDAKWYYEDDREKKGRK